MPAEIERRVSEMELKLLIDEQKILITIEKLAGNIVKEEFHKGALFGLELAQHHRTHTPLEVDAVKDVLLKSDLEYHKQPCTDDGFSEWLAFMANSVCTHFTPRLDVETVRQFLLTADEDMLKKCGFKNYTPKPDIAAIDKFKELNEGRGKDG